MNNKERSNYWQVQIDLWQTSGSNGAQFCKQHGLDLAQFYYWKNKSARLPTKASKEPKQSVGFASVVVTDTGGSPAIGDGLCFALPNGCVIEGITQGNVSLISAILAQL